MRLATRRRTLAIAAPALFALTACSLEDAIVRGGATSQAQFSINPEAQVGPDDRAIPLLVTEEACASGQTADGRVRVDAVEYTADEVRVVLVVRTLDGGQTCQGNPLTAFVLELDEPLGDRQLVNAATNVAVLPLELPDGPLPGEAGGGLVVEPGPGLEGLGEREHFLVASYWARGQDPEELADLGDLFLADEVLLVLGQSGRQRAVVRADLADPDAWSFAEDGEGYEGFSGPFSVLDQLARTEHLVVSIGDHPHCAGPPRPAPAELADFTRLGITPGGIDSCLQWFAVDLYLDDRGLVHGIVLDLFGP